VAENGRATAEALAHRAEAWKATGGRAMELFVLQHLEELLGTVTRAASRVDMGAVSLVDAGDGATLVRYLRAWPAAVAALLEEVSSTLGLDIPAVLAGEREAPLPRQPDGGAHHGHGMPFEGEEVRQ
jgi:flotillin